MEEGQMLELLSGWLAQRQPERGRPALTAVGKPSNGYSAENLVINAEWGASTEKLVLRRDTADPAIYPGQSPGTTTGVVLQHSVMNALRRNPGVPVADSWGLEPDPHLLGHPFFVMRHISGEVPGESPPYTQSGFFVDASNTERTCLVSEGLRVLARVHETMIDDPDLQALRPSGARHGAERQLDLWEETLRIALAGRTSPLFEDCLSWLHNQLPPPAPIVFSWGDARPGNIIWQDFRVACLTDFEGAALGPRELDVGWWLMVDRWMHEGSGADRLAGEPDRSAQRAMYEQSAGTSIGPTAWYEVFSALRFATTVVKVMNRWVANGAIPEDQTVWRDNPATAVLANLLEEAAT
jgi:aminoglycoside phosphotransferase (APT) family kinase protein